MRLHTLEPAYSIILSFSKTGDYKDGLTRVARLIGRSRDAVKRWAYPKHMQGTGGAIPRKAWVGLQLAALSDGRELTLEQLARTGEEG